MERLRAFKFELWPGGPQQCHMRRFAGSCRVVFSEALALQRKRDAQGTKTFGYAGLCKQLTAWRYGHRAGLRRGWPMHPCMPCNRRRTKAQFKCVACGYANHADLVGAMNILAWGYHTLQSVERWRIQAPG